MDDSMTDMAFSVFSAWEAGENRPEFFRGFATQRLEGVKCGTLGVLNSKQAAVFAEIIDNFVEGAATRQRKWMKSRPDEVLADARSEFSKAKFCESLREEMRRDDSVLKGLPVEEARKQMETGSRLFNWLKRFFLRDADRSLVREIRPYLDDKNVADRIAAFQPLVDAEKPDSSEPPPDNMNLQDDVEAAESVYRQGNIAKAVRASADEPETAPMSCVENALVSDLLSPEEVLLEKLYAVAILRVLLPTAEDDLDEIWLSALFASKRGVEAVSHVKAAIHLERLDLIVRDLSEMPPESGDAAEKEV